MIRVWEDKDSQKIVIDIDGQRLKLTKPQAYILVRNIGQILGLRVSTGKPIVSYRYEGTGVVVDIIEGAGSRRFVVDMRLLNAYLNALRRLRPGKYPSSAVARVAFIEARKLGVSDVNRFLEGDELNWELLFGTRDKYYELFRVPVLLLSELGLVEYGKRYITVKSNRGSLKKILESKSSSSPLLSFMKK